MTELIIPCMGTRIDFNNNLRLGVDPIDNQHEQLFRLAIGIGIHLNNDLKDCRSEIESSVLELESYISEHFGFEEAIMKKNGNPNLASHIMAHQRLTTSCAHLRKKIFDPSNQAPSEQAFELFEVLKNWLCDHIMKIDRIASSYMRQKPDGIKPRSPRISLEGRVLVEFSNKRGITGCLRNIGFNSLFLELPPPAPEWIVDSDEGLIHLIPFADKKPIPCQVIRVEPEKGIALILKDKLDMPFITALVRMEHRQS
ncbi:MAG: hemerythrin family protein [Magnetococcales bacterium]|nr:hemerythrin family protein [Magnetococcales bacterium]